LSWDFQIRANEDGRFAAAILIQSAYRRHLIYTNTTKKRLREKSKMLEQKCAMKIQRKFRARSKMKAAKAAWFIQAEKDEKESATIHIQKLFRQRAARKKMERKLKFHRIRVGLEDRVMHLEKLNKEKEEIIVKVKKVSELQPNPAIYPGASLTNEKYLHTQETEKKLVEETEKAKSELARVESKLQIIAKEKDAAVQQVRKLARECVWTSNL